MNEGGGMCNCCSRLMFFWGSKGRERIVRRTNDWGREGGGGVCGVVL